MPDASAETVAYGASRIWTLEGKGPVRDSAVLCRAGRIEGILPQASLPDGVRHMPLGDVDLAPGFVDLQVNGGGGALLNDSPDLACLRTIAEAHRAFGTTSLLPTLITDDAPTMAAARAAVNEAVESIPGVIGAHFEGPFLDERKSGAHDRQQVRAPRPGDLEAMFDGARGVTLVTAACKHLVDGLLEELLGRGAVVSIGHCAGDAATASELFDRGVSMATHLYNAMSPLQHRAPGVVGALLAHDRAACGLIADGVHVDFTAARVAWKAVGSDRMALVTDAVQPVGTDLTSFSLGGQRVELVDGRCINEEGHLAGSALDMASAVRGAVAGMGVPLEAALAMAARTPARIVGMEGEIGMIRVGGRADLVALDDQQRVRAVVQSGVLQDAP